MTAKSRGLWLAECRRGAGRGGKQRKRRSCPLSDESVRFAVSVVVVLSFWQGFRSSPRHLRRRAAAAARLEDVKPAAEVPVQSEQDGAVRRRRLRRGARVPPEFYQSVQSAAARRPAGWGHRVPPPRPGRALRQVFLWVTSVSWGPMVVTLVTRGEPARVDVMICPCRALLLGFPALNLANSLSRFSYVDGESSGNASYRCSMSSSADFSDEDDFSQKSGSASPAPGDTLPWNLPKHERSKRKIHGGSVLDPAERAVLRIAGAIGPVC
ncbi:hypothetical protein E5288_WYG011407 [Bos mutus]|uniref:Microtubule-actin cross-linking factor 1 n=1 Tax=Bos mutus TaxID=72004 RepID=A0A6B0RDS4_9CETA|nr:hypothetical protein [Bos mutus]